MDPWRAMAQQRGPNRACQVFVTMIFLPLITYLELENYSMYIYICGGLEATVACSVARKIALYHTQCHSKFN